MELAPRTRSAAQTIADIVDVATREFADKGLAGARVDAIAEAMRTSKRMIYYHFGSKEGLYLAVLEDAYRRIRRTEATLSLDDLPPVAALRRLVEFTVDHRRENPEFVRLLMNENMLRGQYLAQSRIIRNLNAPAIDTLRGIYQRGLAAGVFRPGLDAVDLHMSISALSFFNVANRHTFGMIFGGTDDGGRARRESIVEMVLRHVCIGAPVTEPAASGRRAGRAAAPAARPRRPGPPSVPSLGETR